MIAIKPVAKVVSACLLVIGLQRGMCACMQAPVCIEPSCNAYLRASSIGWAWYWTIG